LITNVDADHLDHYGSLEAFDQAFIDFASAASELVVISSDDPGAVRVSKKIVGPKVVTFGEAAHADVRLAHIDTTTGGVTLTSNTWEPNTPHNSQCPDATMHSTLLELLQLSLGWALIPPLHWQEFLSLAERNAVLNFMVSDEVSASMTITPTTTPKLMPC
jgi:UDP-N-acetylmuramoylalanine-D-glutamate ligase